MIGEILALASAAFYGFAGFSIARSSPTARGDNGVFLSVCVTAVLSLVLWLGWGTRDMPMLAQMPGDAFWSGIGWFALSGVFATILGRTFMYRSTAHSGAVVAGLYRRLIPLFAIPCAYLLLDETPGSAVLAGGLVIMVGVFGYLLPAARMRAGDAQSAWRHLDRFGLASALCYALAYTARKIGLADMPDPLLGTFIGALVGIIWLVVPAAMQTTRKQAFRFLLHDRTIWHWASALALGLGQTLQFFALHHADVAVVAILGALDVLFAAVLAGLLFRSEAIALHRLIWSLLLTVLGTFILFQ